MFTDGSAINVYWSDTTLMDNLRAADITATSIAGSTETNVRGGHSVLDASGEVMKSGWLHTQFNVCTGEREMQGSKE